MKKKELHVLYIITKLELGGAQKVCLSLFQGLRTHNHKSFLISGKEGPLVSSVTNGEGICLLGQLKREVSFLTMYNELSLFMHLFCYIRLLKKQYPDLIVHTHSTKAGLIGRWAAFFAHVSTRIHTVHGFGFHPYQNKIAWLINYMLEFFTSYITTHYICVSSSDIQTGKKLLSFFASKHSLIRAAASVPTNIIDRGKKRDGQLFVFGTVSCFKRQKNLIDLFSAFALCLEKNSNIHLEVIGDGLLRTKLESWIEKHNLKQHITLLGWRNNISDYLNRWDAFALTSLWEGLPCAIVEARYFKLPVITYNVGGISDIIFHKQNGFLCPPSNVMLFASYMIQLLNDPVMYHKLSTFNDQLHDFQPSSMIKAHLALYQYLTRNMT